jgi:hypothetical protein
MTFHKVDFVEKQLNLAFGGHFVQSIDQKTTKDKDGKEFNVFIIHPNQDFTENGATLAVYSKLKTDGVININIGNKGHNFWKVKLYVPNLKAKFIPEKPKKNVPRIMTDDDLEEYRIWKEKRDLAKKAKAAEAKGPWETDEKDGEDGEVFE